MPGDGSNLLPNQQRTEEGEVHHWLLTGARRKAWKHPNYKKQLVIQQFLLSDSITTPPHLSFILSAFISLPLFPSNQVLSLSSLLSLKKKNGQQKAFSPENNFTFMSCMQAHTVPPKPMQLSNVDEKQHRTG